MERRIKQLSAPPHEQDHDARSLLMNLPEYLFKIFLSNISVCTPDGSGFTAPFTPVHRARIAASLEKTKLFPRSSRNAIKAIIASAHLEHDPTVVLHKDLHENEAMENIVLYEALEKIRNRKLSAEHRLHDLECLIVGAINARHAAHKKSSPAAWSTFAENVYLEHNLGGTRISLNGSSIGPNTDLIHAQTHLRGTFRYPMKKSSSAPVVQAPPPNNGGDDNDDKDGGDDPSKNSSSRNPSRRHHRGGGNKDKDKAKKDSTTSTNNTTEKTKEGSLALTASESDCVAIGNAPFLLGSVYKLPMPCFLSDRAISESSSADLDLDKFSLTSSFVTTTDPTAPATHPSTPILLTSSTPPLPHSFADITKLVSVCNDDSEIASPSSSSASSRASIVTTYAAAFSFNSASAQAPTLLNAAPPQLQRAVSAEKVESTNRRTPLSNAQINDFLTDKADHHVRLTMLEGKTTSCFGVRILGRGRIHHNIEFLDGVTHLDVPHVLPHPTAKFIGMEVFTPEPKKKPARRSRRSATSMVPVQGSAAADTNGRTIDPRPAAPPSPAQALSMGAAARSSQADTTQESTNANTTTSSNAPAAAASPVARATSGPSARVAHVKRPFNVGTRTGC